MTSPVGVRFGARALLTLALYAAMAVGTPFAHDSPACHQQNRTHCVSCSFTGTPAAMADRVPAPVAGLPPVGVVGVERDAAQTTDPLLTTADRSPPSRRSR
jgi:hypothetical protein